MIEIDKSSLYENRILVFLEISPQSNKYNQVLFSNTEFQKMTKCIGTKSGKMLAPTVEEIIINTGTEEHKLPDLKSYE